MIFANEAAWNLVYQAFSKISASWRMKDAAEEERRAAEPTSSEEMSLKDYFLRLQAKKALQRMKLIPLRNANSEPTTSDEMVLRDYAIRLGRKLAWQQRRLVPRSKATVCQTCGAPGFSELLLFCINCQISAVHRYCLHEIPENNEVKVLWVCEQCMQRACSLCSCQCTNSKRSGISVFSSHPSRKGSEHGGRGLPSGISYSAEEIIDSGPGIEMNKGDKKNKKCLEILLNCDGEDAESLRIGHTPASENPFNSILIETKDGQDHDIGWKCPSEYQVGVKVPVDANALNSLGSQPVELHDHYAHAKPIVDPIWRGFFDVNNSQYGMIVGHLSSKACFKVFEGARRLPSMLFAEKLPRAESWPKAFQRLHPTDENIGLYFFPDNRRDENLFEELLHDINSHDLALRISAGEADLLVFSSLLLPEQLRKFRGRRYLWGLFKAKKASFP